VALRRPPLAELAGAQWTDMLAILDQRARAGQTLTYLELADAIALPGPHRIHRLTELLESLLSVDSMAQRPIRAALVTSRARPGRPAPGFFDCAQRLGLFDGADPDRFHDALLAQVFADDDVRDDVNALGEHP